MRTAAATVLLTGATGAIGRTLAHRLSQAAMPTCPDR
jgi:short-subunit dehydrogenase involved in D-alanine esterification of teichoic acids